MTSRPRWCSLVSVALSVALASGACTARNAAYTGSTATLVGGSALTLLAGWDYDGSDDDTSDEAFVGLGLGMMALGAIGLLITARPWESGGPDEAVSATTRKVGCDVLAIEASRDQEPSIDDALAALQPNLTSAFSSWNRFHLVAKGHRELAGDTGQPVQLATGAASSALVEVVDAARIRVTIAFDDANGQRLPGNTSMAARGRYAIYGHAASGGDGHLLALRCD